MNRVRRLKFVLWLVTGLALAVAVSRFLFGLGASTHLSDSNPWGLWIGFDVMSGVALAAGGFIVTATVYVFKLTRYHAVVPDMKWLIFRSNMSGANQVYAVEVKTANQR